MPGPHLAPLRSVGRHVWVHTVVPDDVLPYQAAVRLSAARIGVWNPVNPEDIRWHLQRQSEEHRTFLIHAVDPEGSHGIVGKVNVTNVVRGRFQSGVLGYDAYDPYVGRSLFSEGLRQVVGLAFTPSPQGMGLHRLEANVRPGNARSAGLLRSLGFRREGLVRDMLWLADGGGSAWRDHIMHAVTREEWPASAYAPHRQTRIALLVNGIPGRNRSVVAARLAAELGLPHFSGDVLQVGPEGPQDVFWQLLAASPIGGLVEYHWPAADREVVGAGLRRAGFDPAVVPHVWCETGSGSERFGFGVPLTVDGSRPADARTVTRIALQARAAFAS